MIMEYSICTRCIMDTSDPQICFDEHGVCNHCLEFDQKANILLLPSEEKNRQLEIIVNQIKKEGVGKEFDCILGLSGGIDSSYLAYFAAKQGLRPLVVHVDCGWNSELAVKNIENIVKHLKFELHTHVVDWEEMKDLQVAFIKASLANLDIPQDHAIFAALYRFAVKNSIKYVLNGSNFETESVLPESWGYNALDYRHIMGVHRRFGKIPLKSFPRVTFFQRYIYFTIIKRMKVVKLLNYIDYNKVRAIEVLSNELGWRYYGGKHHESRFTKFFQAYYLPEKFGYDKRRAHLSSLILAGKLSRADALVEMSQPVYKGYELEEDFDYIAKKLDLTIQELKEMINRPKKSYLDYPSNVLLFKISLSFRKHFRSFFK
jgi:N-acetyl sugar amidotransferase